MNANKKMKFKRASEMRNVSELTQEELDQINQVKPVDDIIKNENEDKKVDVNENEIIELENK